MDKISYALGLSIGNNFQNSGINNLQVEDFVKGVNDVLSGAQPAISYDEAKQIIKSLLCQVVYNIKFCRKEKEQNQLPQIK